MSIRQKKKTEVTENDERQTVLLRFVVWSELLMLAVEFSRSTKSINTIQ